jgi:hypothetical protein
MEGDGAISPKWVEKVSHQSAACPVGPGILRSGLKVGTLRASDIRSSYADIMNKTTEHHCIERNDPDEEMQAIGYPPS